LDPNFTNKQMMEEADYANSVKSSECLMHGLECDPSERITKLLYTGPVATNDNLNLYNLGNFQLATQGMSVTGVNVGELWISYDITFYKKQIEVVQQGTSLKLASIIQGNFTSGGGMSVGGGTSVNTLGMTLSGFNITFPSNISTGSYQIFVYCVLAVTGSIVTSPFGISPTNATLNGSVAFSNGSTATQFVASAVYNITGPSAVIPISGTNCLTGGFYISVTQVNPLLSI
jgi:hypothetical protein